MKRTYYTIALTLVLTVGMVGGIGVVSAQEEPGNPAQFYGEIEDGDGTPAPAGTTLVAVVDGTVEDEITIDTAGEYGDEDAFGDKLTINTAAGEEVSFYLDNSDGPEASEGSPRELNDGGVIEHNLVFAAGEFEEAEDDDDDENNENDDDNGDDGGNGGGGAAPAPIDEDDEDTDDDTEDTADSEGEVTVEDVTETVSQSEPTTQIEAEIEAPEEEGAGASVDTSEDTESVKGIVFEDDNVEGSVSVEEYTDREVTDTTADSISQSVEQDVSDDLGGEETDSESSENTDSDATGDATAAGTTTSVSVSSVAQISVDNPDTAATVTMSADADEITDPESTSIYHETDDGWEELPTEVEDQTDEEITFSGETDGFSLFAVAEVQQVEQEADTDNNNESNEPEETDSGIPGFGIPVALVALIALAALARQREF